MQVVKNSPWDISAEIPVYSRESHRLLTHLQAVAQQVSALAWSSYVPHLQEAAASTALLRINPTEQGILLITYHTDLLLNWRKPTFASPSLPFFQDEQNFLTFQILLWFASSLRSTSFSFRNPTGCGISHRTMANYLCLRTLKRKWRM